jgi:hypothetical protein
VTKYYAFLFLAILSSLAARSAGGVNLNWRSATESELKDLIPTRAPVERGHIETEFRTASGIKDDQGKYVAGVVLITVGYAADGKYSNFFLTQMSIKVGDILLRPGEYVFGWQRKNNDSLTVKFYEAQSGKSLGDVEARRLTGHRVESFRISPPSEQAVIQVGRFAMPYRFVE